MFDASAKFKGDIVGLIPVTFKVVSFIPGSLRTSFVDVEMK